jgi:hypothetical protein
MGAWGTGIFESDGALDFVGMVIQTDDLAAIESALNEVLAEDDYLDAYVSETALVSGEVIAALRGHPGELPDDLREWISKVGSASVEMAHLAQQAIHRIMTANSELRELWEESDEFDLWQQGIDDLLQRLANSL